MNDLDVLTPLSEYDVLFDEQLLLQRVHFKVPGVWSMVQEVQEIQRYNTNTQSSLQVSDTVIGCY